MQYGLGCIQDDPDDRDITFSSIFKKEIDLPSKSDILLSHLPPVVDQGQTSQCTAASSTRAAKTRMNLTQYKWPHTPSAAYLYAKVREHEGTPLTQDCGARIRSIFKVWNTLGVCPEDSNPEWSWPWTTDPSRIATRPSEACDRAATMHKCTKYMRLGPDPDETRHALAMGLPVVIGMMIPESMCGRKTSKDGIIRIGFRDQFIGGHAMFLHSYSLFKDYFTGRNSWGASWGDGGNFHLSPKHLSDPEIVMDRWAIEVLT